MSSLWRRQIVTAARPFLPHFPHAFPAFSSVPFGLAGVGAVGLTPLGQKCLSADRTGPQLRGDAFRCQRRLKLRVKGQDSLTEVTAVRPCPALVQHIAGTVKRKAQAAFPVIVGAHPRDKRTDFLLLVTGQLPGVHLRLRATMARRAGLHDQRPEFLPALFFLSFALLVVTASLTRVVIVPAGCGTSFIIRSKGLLVKFILIPPYLPPTAGYLRPRVPLRSPPAPRPHIRSNHLPNPGLHASACKS